MRRTLYLQPNMPRRAANVRTRSGRGRDHFAGRRRVAVATGQKHQSSRFARVLRTDTIDLRVNGFGRGRFQQQAWQEILQHEVANVGDSPWRLRW